MSIKTIPVVCIRVETVEAPISTYAVLKGDEPNLRACERFAKKAAAKAHKAYMYFDVEVMHLPYATAWQATKDYNANAFRAV